MMRSFHRYLPVLDWGCSYTRETLTSDLVAAVIVTIMLIPQSLAYALLAGLPAQAGLYASIVPICSMLSSAPVGRWPWGRWRSCRC